MSAFKSVIRSEYSHGCFTHCQDVLVIMSTFPVHSPSLFPKPSPCCFTVLVLTNLGFRLVPRNTIPCSATLLSFCSEICLLARHLHKTFNTFYNKKINNSIKHRAKNCSNTKAIYVITLCTLTHTNRVLKKKKK